VRHLASEQRDALRQALGPPEAAVVPREHALHPVPLDEVPRDLRRKLVGPLAPGLEHGHVHVAVDDQAGQAVGLGVHPAAGALARRERRGARADRRVEARPPELLGDVGGRVARHDAQRDARARVVHRVAATAAGRPLERDEAGGRRGVAARSRGRRLGQLVAVDPRMAVAQLEHARLVEEDGREGHRPPL
jgi:hypothetical protein